MTEEPVRDESPRDEAELERLMAATLFLMTQHARCGCPRLACIVGRHLSLLAKHPAAGRLVRDMAGRLAPTWRPATLH